ncbi:hypothetical protein BESB_040520 [Besnoitia besnoiti]|uniref:Uncharacterized protein n=1 Tax=Besnoitia besnoiti TaxID=94643 RepID=A0A2A9MK68_BESBE|nr:hypothetical protein BESB_040520 [Besnoitia besnoiti]PFH37594.1 hypothetical protein BESB_040520 [Besnoitia besnoiti]
MTAPPPPNTGGTSGAVHDRAGPFSPALKPGLGSCASCVHFSCSSYSTTAPPTPPASSYSLPRFCGLPPAPRPGCASPRQMRAAPVSAAARPPQFAARSAPILRASSSESSVPPVCASVPPLAPWSPPLGSAPARNGGFEKNPFALTGALFLGWGGDESRGVNSDDQQREEGRRPFEEGSRHVRLTADASQRGRSADVPARRTGASLVLLSAGKETNALSAEALESGELERKRSASQGGGGCYGPAHAGGERAAAPRTDAQPTSASQMQLRIEEKVKLQFLKLTDGYASQRPAARLLSKHQTSGRSPQHAAARGSTAASPFAFPALSPLPPTAAFLHEKVQQEVHRTTSLPAPSFARASRRPSLSSFSEAAAKHPESSLASQSVDASPTSPRGSIRTEQTLLSSCSSVCSCTEAFPLSAASPLPGQEAPEAERQSCKTEAGSGEESQQESKSELRPTLVGDGEKGETKNLKQPGEGSEEYTRAGSLRESIETERTSHRPLEGVVRTGTAEQAPGRESRDPKEPVQDTPGSESGHQAENASLGLQADKKSLSRSPLSRPAAHSYSSASLPFSASSSSSQYDARSPSHAPSSWDEEESGFCSLPARREDRDADALARSAYNSSMERVVSSPRPLSPASLDRRASPPLRRGDRGGRLPSYSSLHSTVSSSSISSSRFMGLARTAQSLQARLLLNLQKKREDEEEEFYQLTERQEREISTLRREVSELKKALKSQESQEESRQSFLRERENQLASALQDREKARERERKRREEKEQLEDRLRDTEERLGEKETLAKMERKNLEAVWRKRLMKEREVFQHEVEKLLKAKEELENSRKKLANQVKALRTRLGRAAPYAVPEPKKDGDQAEKESEGKATATAAPSVAQPDFQTAKTHELTSFVALPPPAEREEKETENEMHSQKEPKGERRDVETTKEGERLSANSSWTGVACGEKTGVPHRVSADQAPESPLPVSCLAHGDSQSHDSLSSAPWTSAKPSTGLQAEDRTALTSHAAAHASPHAIHPSAKSDRDETQQGDRELLRSFSSPRRLPLPMRLLRGASERDITYARNPDFQSSPPLSLAEELAAVEEQSRRKNDAEDAEKRTRRQRRDPIGDVRVRAADSALGDADATGATDMTRLPGQRECTEKAKASLLGFDPPICGVAAADALSDDTTTCSFFSLPGRDCDDAFAQMSSLTLSTASSSASLPAVERPAPFVDLEGQQLLREEPKAEGGGSQREASGAPGEKLPLLAKAAAEGPAPPPVRAASADSKAVSCPRRIRSLVSIVRLSIFWLCPRRKDPELLSDEDVVAPRSHGRAADCQGSVPPEGARPPDEQPLLAEEEGEDGEAAVSGSAALGCHREVTSAVMRPQAQWV